MSGDPYIQAKQIVGDVYRDHMGRAGYTRPLGAPMQPASIYGISLGADGTLPFVQEVLDMFTQQHYEALARTMERIVMRYDAAKDAEGRRVAVEVVNELTEELEKDNPKFKKFKFIEAALAKANAAKGATTEE